MADPNPRGEYAPSHDPALSESELPASSLVEDLGAIADDIRQIATDLGARPYTVHAVRLRWTGGEVGRGEPEPSLDVQMLPTPDFRQSLDRPTDSSGAVERGDATLVGVSPRYTESDLEAMLGVSADAAEECFIEVRIDERDGRTIRRRFTLAKPAERRPTKCDWRLVLRRYAGDRAVDGTRRPERQERWR